MEAAAFDAFDEQLQRDVVVKIVHPDLTVRKELRQALQAVVVGLADLHHPNLAALLDHGMAEWNGHQVVYLVGEQLTGGSLRDVLDRGRLLSPSQAVVVGLDACKALDALHRRGMVHGDVRPATLVFGADRRLRLVDAGVTALCSDATGGVQARSNDVAKYAAPEQAGGVSAQARSDVYSLCLTLVEAITGAVPFVGESTVATLAARVDRLLPVSADLGPLASVLERAGRPHSEDRSTAAEFGRGLVSVAGRMPRPEPLPLLVSSLFTAAPVTAAAPVAQSVAPEPAVAETEAAVPAPGAPDGVADDGVAPVVLAVVPDDDLDPDDEFPEPPPPPSTSRRWFLAVLAVLAVAGGTLAWYNTRPDELQVPAVIGLDAAEARNLLADFSVVEVDEADETAAVGTVVRTDPAAGARIDEGSTVTIYVSTGPAPRVLPELTGLNLDEARAKLEALGLVVELSDPLFDEAIPAGTVLSWTVPESPGVTAGSTVLRGTTVRLVTSAGPAPRTVPDLAGLTLVEATATLEGMGLTITQVADEFSPTVPVGQVTRQDPVAGTSLDRGGTVTVALSKGPDVVTLPNLAGLTFDQVRAALEGAGFTVGTVSGDPATAPLNKVIVNGAVVTTGFVAPRGTPVDLDYIPDPPPSTTIVP